MKREWALPATYSGSDEWLRFFRRLGLVDRIDAALFLAFAREVRETARHNPMDARKRAVLLIQHLNEHYSDFVTSLNADARTSPTASVGTCSGRGH